MPGRFFTQSSKYFVKLDGMYRYTQDLLKILILSGFFKFCARIVIFDIFGYVAITGLSQQMTSAAR